MPVSHTYRHTSEETAVIAGRSGKSKPSINHYHFPMQINSYIINITIANDVYVQMTNHKNERHNYILHPSMKKATPDVET